MTSHGYITKLYGEGFMTVDGEPGQLNLEFVEALEVMRVAGLELVSVCPLPKAEQLRTGWHCFAVFSAVSPAAIVAWHKDNP